MPPSNDEEMMMRGLVGAGAVAALLASPAYAQQRPGASYPVPGHAPMVHAGPQRMMPPVRGYDRAERWPSRDGRWGAGWNAPGGWNAYRRPYVGWALPVYWTQPGFLVSDWADYRLPPPPAGRHWTRYYDDAVLVDSRGSVFDTVEGVDWDHVNYAEPAPPPPRPPRVGAATYASNKAEERRGYRAGYPPPPPYHDGGNTWISPDGRTTVTTSDDGGTTTTVTVQNAPAVTTTTTEYFDDAVTYSPARKVYRKRVWRPKSKLMRRY